MTLLGLALRGLWHHRGAHLTVAAAVALAAAVLTGALATQDTLRATLRRNALERLQGIETAVEAPALFRAQLAEVAGDFSPAIRVDAVASTPEGETVLPRVTLWGVDERLAGQALGDDDALVSPALGLKAGAAIILRFEPPGGVPREAALSNEDATVTLEATVVGDAPGLSLAPTQDPPRNVFVPLKTLQAALRAVGRANVLVGKGRDVEPLLRGALEPEDVEIEVSSLEESTFKYVSTPRIFLPGALVKEVEPEAVWLTWLTTDIALGARHVPLSFVSGISGDGGLLDDEIELVDWAARELDAHVGDVVELRYPVLGTGRAMRENTTKLRVKRIGPTFDDSILMPEIPGIADVASCRDWTPGFHIDVGAFRPVDEAYWRKYGGSPKAYVTLETAQRLWGSVFGDVTGMRVKSAESVRFAVFRLGPAAFGWTIRDVRGEALARADPATDFASLFLGLAGLLVLAALLLAVLAVSLSLERRLPEVSALKAMGWGAKRIFSLFWLEFASVAFVGAVLGSLVGGLTTRAALALLASASQASPVPAELAFVVSPGSRLIGAAAALIGAILGFAWALRRALRPRAETIAKPVSKLWLLLFIPAFGLHLRASHAQGELAATLWISSGFVALLAGLAAVRLALGRRRDEPLSSIPNLSFRQLARRPSRSLAIIALAGLGTFLVVAIGAQERLPDASGTAGFSLIGELSRPLPEPPADDRVQALRVRRGDDASCLTLGQARVPMLLGVPFSKLKLPFLTAPAVPLDRLDDGALPVLGDEATVVWGLHKKVGDELTIPTRGTPIRLKIEAIAHDGIFQGALLADADLLAGTFPDEAPFGMLLVSGDANLPEIEADLKSRYRDRGLTLEPTKTRLARYLSIENAYLAVFGLLAILALALAALGLAIVVARQAEERRGELGALRSMGFSRAAVIRLVAFEHLAQLALGALVGLFAAVLATIPSIRGGTMPWARLLGGCALALLVGALAAVLAARAATRGRPADALRDDPA